MSTTPPFLSSLLPKDAIKVAYEDLQKRPDVNVVVPRQFLVQVLAEHMALNDLVALGQLQLAGCFVAASDVSAPIARPGDAGWTPAYQAVLDLRAQAVDLGGRLTRALAELESRK